MKILYLNLLIILWISVSFGQEKIPHIINFFFRPLPYTKKSIDKDDLQFTISTIGTTSELAIEKSLTNNFLVNGIIVTYAGFWTYSNINGEIIVPRRNKKPRIKILVTQSIIPIFEPTIDRPSRTINHWELVNPNLSKFYVTELKQDPDIKLYFWHTSQKKLQKIIPNDTLIIFANPKYIILPTGPIKLGINTPHFLLPDIFVSPKVNKALNVLRFLKIKKYFAPIRIETRFDKLGYQQQINV